MVNKIEIVVMGKNLTKPEFDAAVRDARSTGERVGTDFSRGVQDQVDREMPSLLPPVDEQKEKAKGAAAGDAASKGMSPLLIGAFTAAATIGPAAILGGVATATVGVAALVAKSNAQIGQDYQTLGQNIESVMTNAVAPIVPQIDAGVKVLEQGLTTVGPQLDQLFAAVGPDVSQLATGLVKLAEGALPGITSGLRAVEPIVSSVATDFGKIGEGIGGFFSGLGAGAGGSAIGLSALSKSLSELLPDIGQITGDLANGLGPALRDVLAVADPLAGALTAVIGAIPPGALEVAAAGAALLFGAFKGVSLVGAAQDAMLGFSTKLAGVGIAEGAAATETEVLAASIDNLAVSIAALAGVEGAATGGVAALGVAEDAAAVETGVLAKAQAGLAVATGATSSVVSAAAGPYGLLAGALFIASDQISKHTAVQLNLFSVISTLNKAYNTHATAVGDAGKAIEGIAGHFTSATQKADDLTAALTTQREQVSGNAQTTATSTLAALDATDGQSKLTQQLYQSLTGYSAATTGASAYGSALTALNGTTQTVDDAQNSLAQQMLNAKTSFAQNKYSMDLNTQAGIDNRDALSAAAKAITQLGISQYQATGSIGNANDVIQAQINQFVANTGATGKNKDAIYAYLESLAKIPPNVSTDVNLNTSGAFGQLANLLETINTSSGVVHVYESTSGVVTNSSFGRGFGAKASGGVVGAFSGMVRGGRTLVGEYGAEVVDLPMGSTVHSNPDTQRMLSEGGGGSPMRVQFELVGSSDPVLSGLWEALRKHIRVRGGNGSNSVQKALGQPF